MQPAGKERVPELRKSYLFDYFKINDANQKQRKSYTFDSVSEEVEALDLKKFTFDCDHDERAAAERSHDFSFMRSSDDAASSSISNKPRLYCEEYEKDMTEEEILQMHLTSITGPSISQQKWMAETAPQKKEESNTYLFCPEHEKDMSDDEILKLHIESMTGPSISQMMEAA